MADGAEFLAVAGAVAAGAYLLMRGQGSDVLTITENVKNVTQETTEAAQSATGGSTSTVPKKTGSAEIGPVPNLDFRGFEPNTDAGAVNETFDKAVLADMVSGGGTISQIQSSSGLGDINPGI